MMARSPTKIRHVDDDMLVDTEPSTSNNSSVRRNIYATTGISDVSADNSDDNTNWHASVEHNGGSKTKKLKTESAEILTRNKFAPLSADTKVVRDVLHSGMENGKDDVVVRPVLRGNTKMSSRYPPVTIVNTDGKLDLKMIFSNIKLLIKSEFKIRNFNRFKTSIFVSTSADFDIIVSYLKQHKIPFFTHVPRDRKPIKMVLKGLPSSFTNDEIADELKKSAQVVSVTQFSKKTEDNRSLPLPVYVVTFPPNTLSHQIVEIKVLFSCIVRWEKYNRKTPYLQCYRCLRFGHVSQNCQLPDRCMRCGDRHSSVSCNVQTYKCANCLEEHRQIRKNAV